MQLIEAEEAGVKLQISEIEGQYEVKVTVTYNFVTSYQRTLYKMVLSKKEFIDLRDCLNEGKKSWHGNSSVWQANKIYVKKRNHPNRYREIRMYRRYFILGFNVVPACFAQSLMSAINSIEV